MVILDELPEGIIDEILRFSTSDDWHTTRRTCYALCLTSQNLLTVARRKLYSRVTLEYSRTRTTCQSFRRTLMTRSDIANNIRSLRISTGLGSVAKDQDSQDLAHLLKDVLGACKNIQGLTFDSEDASRNHEDLYLAAWRVATFSKFTLRIGQFRELVLLPDHRLESLSIELARGGDLQYDYDIMLESWPSRTVQADTVRFRGFPFPAYSDQIMLGKLAQMFRAIQAPKTLVLERCTFSKASITALLGHWAMDSVEELEIDRCTICDSKDKMLAEYYLPRLPKLRLLKLRSLQTMIGGIASTVELKGNSSRV